MKFLATFQNDPWKFTDVKALTVISYVRSWKMRKRIHPNFFLRLWKKPELILINMFSPTFVPNLVTLAWTRQIWGIWKLRLAYSPETSNLGQNRWYFVPCDLEIWWMTLENNRASLLCCFKLCATFHSHRWIQAGVTVRKCPIWVKFDYL